MMWQEARKQEKKIRGLLVDYKRRAERRKDYYEKIRADPTQFIQLHGRPCKIHLDPAVAIAADSPANMMSWQGNHDILIDRFDVRAHLDIIPDTKSKQDEEELNQEDRLINYERYRILAQNDFLGVSEEKFLHQLSVEEQFGPVEKPEPQAIEGKKKVAGAAIGYNYNEGTPMTATKTAEGEDDGSPSSEDDEDDEDSDIDFDLCVDVDKISSAQAHEMNASALNYGMVSNDFFSFLTKDVEEAENIKLAREREEEKAMFSGRKSRRERRAYREKKLMGRKISPPSYAASKDAPIADLIRNVTKARSRTRSRSASPPNAGMIQYITSFGGEEPPLEPPPPQIIKASVHSSKKEEPSLYKRTVRYRSSRSPEPAKKSSRPRSISAERSVRYRSRSREKPLADNSRRSKSHSPNWRSRSPISRRVRYRSRSKSRSPHHSVRGHERVRGARGHELSPQPNRSHSKSRSPRSTTRTYDRGRDLNDCEPFSPRPTRSCSRSRSPRHTARSYDRGRNLEPSSSRPIRKRQSYSRSRSPSPAVRVVKKTNSPPPVRSIEIPAPPVITRYYGRHKKESSSSELDLSDSEDKNENMSDKASASSTAAVGNSCGRSKPSAMSAAKLSLQERLKKKRQALINRQYKADKRAERLRLEKAEQERQDREDEMREISIKMRRRERQKRHRYYELDDTNAADMSDEDGLSDSTSGSVSESGSQHRPKNSSTKAPKEPEISQTNKEINRDHESKRDSGSKRDVDSKRDKDRSSEKERRKIREEDRTKERIDERSRRRDRSRDKNKARSRSRERSRRDRERSKERGRERSRERERNSRRYSVERESERNSRRYSIEREPRPSLKKPLRPLVDY